MHRSFCMRVIRIICQFQAYESAGGGNKKRITLKFGLESRKNMFSIIADVFDKILAIGLIST